MIATLSMILLRGCIFIVLLLWAFLLKFCLCGLGSCWFICLNFVIVCVLLVIADLCFNLIALHSLFVLFWVFLGSLLGIVALFDL